MSTSKTSDPPNDPPSLPIEPKPGPSKYYCSSSSATPTNSSESETSSSAESSGPSKSKLASKKRRYRPFRLNQVQTRPIFRSASDMIEAGAASVDPDGKDRLNNNPAEDHLNFHFSLEDESPSIRYALNISGRSLAPCEYPGLPGYVEPKEKKRKAKIDCQKDSTLLHYYKRVKINHLDCTDVPANPQSASNSDDKDSEAGPSTAREPSEELSPTIEVKEGFASDPPPEVEKKAVERDETYYFGLFGATGKCEEEDMGPNCFDWLPLPVMEQILCQVPFQDLLNLRLVSRTWNDIIISAKFLEWKKAYYRFKIEGELEECLRQAISTNFCDTRVTNCFRSLIEFMAYNYPRRPSPKMIDLLRHASKFPEAEAVILERFPKMNAENLSPWSVLAMLVLLSQTVWDVYDIFNCVMCCGSLCPLVDVLDAFYCVATFLLFFKLNYKINHGLHYRLYYALYLFENNIQSNLPQPPIVESIKMGQQSLHTYCYPVEPKMTYEQIRILSHRMAPKQVVKIIAFAGTGKTSTLIHYARLYPQLKFLNVMFNKSVCEYAKKCFPPNVECRTSHSLAYQAIGKSLRHKLCQKLKPHDIVPHIKKPENVKLHIFTYAKYVLQTIEAFTASKNECITTEHVPLASQSQCLRSIHNTVAVRNVQLSDAERLAIANDAAQVWDKMVDPSQKYAIIVHDIYLKLYQLTHPKYKDYDCIMIDEAQDCNEAMLDIMLSQNVPVFLIGDPNQQIYSFRGATNALGSVKATHLYHLTKSFRFGPEIAYIASCCIEILKCNSRETLVGSDKKCYIDGSVKGQYAVIARTNFQLFQEAVILCCTSSRRLNEPREIQGAFAGGLNSYGLDQLLDIYRLYTAEEKNVKQITDKFIRKFSSFEELYHYTKKAEDYDLQGKLDLVFEHREHLFDYVKVIKKKCSYPMELANVVFSTAHKSKGLEFDTVCITNDYRIGSVPCERPTINSPIGEEYNILYVALTRAKRCLLLSESLYKVLLLAQEKFEYPVLSAKLLLDSPKIRCINCTTDFVPSTVLVLHRQTTKMANGHQVEGGPLCMKCGTTPRFRPEIHRSPAVVFLDFVEDTGHRSMSTLVGPLPSDPPIIYDDVMMPNIGAQHVIFQVNFH